MMMADQIAIQIGVALQDRVPSIAGLGTGTRFGAHRALLLGVFEQPSDLLRERLGRGCTNKGAGFTFAGQVFCDADRCRDERAAGSGGF